MNISINDQLKALYNNWETTKEDPSALNLFGILLQMNGWKQCPLCLTWHEPTGMVLLSCRCGYRFDSPAMKPVKRLYDLPEHSRGNNLLDPKVCRELGQAIKEAKESRFEN